MMLVTKDESGREIREDASHFDRLPDNAVLIINPAPIKSRKIYKQEPDAIIITMDAAGNEVGKRISKLEEIPSNAVLILNPSDKLAANYCYDQKTFESFQMNFNGMAYNSRMVANR